MCYLSNHLCLSIRIKHWTIAINCRIWPNRLCLITDVSIRVRQCFNTFLDCKSCRDTSALTPTPSHTKHRLMRRNKKSNTNNGYQKSNFVYTSHFMLTVILFFHGDLKLDCEHKRIVCLNFISSAAINKNDCGGCTLTRIVRPLRCVPVCCSSQEMIRYLLTIQY